MLIHHFLPYRLKKKFLYFHILNQFLKNNEKNMTNRKHFERFIFNDKKYKKNQI